MRKGFIYQIDYIGDHPLIKGCSYAGSKKESQAHKWDQYFGSPSKIGCVRCAAWKLESKKHPHLFVKTIVRDVMQHESIIECEVEYLRSVSGDIVADSKWLNSAIPRIGAFPEFHFTSDQMCMREQKRKATMLKKIGFEHNFQDTEKMKLAIHSKYGVENINQRPKNKLRNSLHKKQYFANMTEDERKTHGLKSLKGRDPVNVQRGIEKQKQTKHNWSAEYKQELESKRREKWQQAIDSHTPEKRAEISSACKHASTMLRKQYYITLEYIDSGKIESKFLNDWLRDGFARDGIMYRIKANSKDPLYSRTQKMWVRVVSHEKRQPLSL